MKNSTNGLLYSTPNSEKNSTETNKAEIEDKELLKKLKLIEKAFR